ncbi:unnamed protein product [Ostreobium quekettii]|uniref:Uncharacterized protein n=1 Tax=Ostreobium quekettii TaxID=121088 RepID=A0A8S1J353_9CHLO|nr:unnamed protein product [Ostreobium quekettii]
MCAHTATGPDSLGRRHFPRRRRPNRRSTPLSGVRCAKSSGDARRSGRCSKRDSSLRKTGQSAENLRQAILEIDEEGSAAHRWLPIGEWRTGAFAVGFIALSAMAMDPWAQALADEGETAAAASGDVVAQAGEIFSSQGAFLFTPILLYLIFIVYRTSLNPKAKVTDFLFLVASFFIIFNIISILFFKTRYF